jgi:ATP-binding cassette, subfamily B, bacterial
MPVEEKNKDKKAYSEIWTDIKLMISASIKLLRYAFSKTPGYLTLLLISTLLAALLPFLSQWFNSKVLDQLVGITTQGGDISYLYYLIAAVVITMAVRTINNHLYGFFDMHMWFNVGRELTHDVTKKFSSLDIEYYEDAETLDLLTKVTENYSHRPQNFLTFLFMVLDSLVSVISAIAILIFFKPVFILVLLVTTFPEVIVNVVYGRRSHGIWDAKGDIKRDYHRSRHHLVSENSLMELRIFKVRNYLLDRTYNLFLNFQKEQVAIENKRSSILIASRVLSIVGYTLLFIATLTAVINQEISIGLFTFYMGAVGALQGSLSGLFKQLSRLYENGLYVTDIFKMLSFKEKIVPGTVVLSDKSAPPEIKFNDVTFYYPGTTVPVFENLYLTVNSGDRVAIVGENGSGKTTLIKLLMRFYDVNGGEILIDGINLKELDFESWYSKVGALFQEFNFYHFDAKTNIGVGNVVELANMEKIVASAQKSGADSFIKNYANGYDQILSRDFKGGIKPSVGQKQKIALARAFFKDAPILILDEPTSAIDPKAEFEIFERLFEFARGKTVVIISHRFSTVRNADRIIVLDGGKIIEDGSHEKLMHIEGGKYKTAFEIQKRGYE